MRMAMQVMQVMMRQFISQVKAVSVFNVLGLSFLWIPFAIVLGEKMCFHQLKQAVIISARRG